MRPVSLLPKSTSLLLSLLLFASNTLLLHATESNFWAKRKTQMASVSQKSNVIFHLQDVHRNVEAQTSLADTLQHLLEKEDIDVVALEGAWGPIPVNVFRSIPIKEALSPVVDYHFQDHKLSGPVKTLLLRAESIPPVVGVDDAHHYKKNIDAFRNAATHREPVKQVWGQKWSSLVEKKKTVFNSELASFDEITEGYQSGNVALGDYLKILTTRVRPSSPAIQTFLNALALESKLNLPRVEQEREIVLKQLLNTTNAKSIQDLTQWSMAFQKKQVDPSEFYSFLEKTCRHHQIDLTQTPAFARYLRYVLLSEAISAKEILTDAQRLEKKVYASLIRSDEEKVLVEETRRLRLEKKLIEFSLTPEEWGEYKEKLIHTPPSLPSKRGGTLSSFESFYEQAEARDHAMAANLFSEIEKRDAKRVVLVTGGFHSDGLEKQFTQQGWSTIPIRPKLTHVPTAKGSAYLNVFLQKKTPLESLFEGKKLFLADHPFRPREFGVDIAMQAEMLKAGGYNRIRNYLGQNILLPVLRQLWRLPGKLKARLSNASESGFWFFHFNQKRQLVKREYVGASAASVYYDPVYKWTGAVLLHELGHAVTAVLLLPVMFVLAVVGFLAGLVDKETSLQIFLGFVPREMIVTGAFPSVRIPVLAHMHEWPLFSLLIVLGGPFGFPLFYVYLLFNANVYIVAVLFIPAVLTLILGLLNLFHPVILEDENSDGSRVLRILGIRRGASQNSWAYSFKRIPQDFLPGNEQRQSMWRALKASRVDWEGILHAEPKALVWVLEKLRAEAQAKDSRIEELKQLKQPHFQAYAIPGLGKKVQGLYNWAMRRNTARAEETKTTKMKVIHYLLWIVGEGEVTKEWNEFRSVQEIVNAHGYGRSADYKWTEFNEELMRDWVDHLVAAHLGVPVAEYRKRESGERREEALKLRNEDFQSLEVKVEVIDSHMTAMERYFSSTIRKNKIRKTTRWVILERAGYIETGLPDFSEIQYPSDLVFLFEKRALLPDYILWSDIFEHNEKGFMGNMIRALAATTLFGAKTPVEVQHRLKLVGVNDLLSLKPHHYEETTIPGFEPWLTPTLHMFFIYMSQRSEETSDWTPLALLERSGEIPPVRQLKGAYSIHSIAALSKLGALTKRSFALAEHIPLPAQRSLFYYAALKETTDIGPIDMVVSLQWETIPPFLGSPIRNFIDFFRGRQKKKSTKSPLENVFDHLGFATTEDSVQSYLGVIRDGISAVTAQRKTLSFLTEHQPLIDRFTSPGDLHLHQTEGLRQQFDVALNQLDRWLKKKGAKGKRDLKKWRAALLGFWALMDTAQMRPNEFLEAAQGHSDILVLMRGLATEATGARHRETVDLPPETVLLSEALAALVIPVFKTKDPSNKAPEPEAVTIQDPWLQPMREAIRILVSRPARDNSHQESRALLLDMASNNQRLFIQTLERILGSTERDWVLHWTFLNDFGVIAREMPGAVSQYMFELRDRVRSRGFADRPQHNSAVLGVGWFYSRADGIENKTLRSVVKGALAFIVAPLVEGGLIVLAYAVWPYESKLIFILVGAFIFAMAHLKVFYGKRSRWEWISPADFLSLFLWGGVYLSIYLFVPFEAFWIMTLVHSVNNMRAYFGEGPLHMASPFMRRPAPVEIRHVAGHHEMAQVEILSEKYIGAKAGFNVHEIKEDVIVAVQGDVVVGYIIGSHDFHAAILDQLAVDGGWRGQGIGEDLVHAYLMYLKKFGFLNFMTISSNVDSIGFYHRVLAPVVNYRTHRSMGQLFEVKINSLDKLSDDEREAQLQYLEYFRDRDERIQQALRDLPDGPYVNRPYAAGTHFEVVDGEINSHGNMLNFRNPVAIRIYSVDTNGTETLVFDKDAVMPKEWAQRMVKGGDLSLFPDNKTYTSLWAGMESFLFIGMPLIFVPFFSLEFFVASTVLQFVFVFVIHPLIDIIRQKKFDRSYRVMIQRALTLHGVSLLLALSFSFLFPNLSGFLWIGLYAVLHATGHQALNRLLPEPVSYDMSTLNHQFRPMDLVPRPSRRRIFDQRRRAHQQASKSA